MTQRLDITFYMVGFLKAANRFTGCGDRLFDVNQRVVRWFDDPAANPNPYDDNICARALRHTEVAPVVAGGADGRRGRRRA